MMASKAKIFISSSAQDELKRLRETIFEFLDKQLGHEPLMFEKNFGAWTQHTNSIQKCLGIVKECDILLLLISTKTGSYLVEDDITVTHLEFIEAINNQKTSLVFVEDSIYDHFFANGIRKKLVEACKTFKESKSKPKGKSFSLFIDVVKPMFDKGELPQDIEPYTWVFLMDVAEKGVFCEQFSRGVSLNDKLSEALSDLLRLGNQLLPLASAIGDLPDLDRMEELHELQVSFFKKMKIEPFPPETWKPLLIHLRELMGHGGEILERRGEFFSQRLVKYRGCHAISLYQRNGDLMELVAKEGRLGGQAFYHLESDVKHSYIVQSYIAADEKVRLWYREEKKTVYLTFRVNEFVMCIHFVLESKLPKDFVEQRIDDFICGIMEEQGDCIGLVQLVLGGMKHATT